MADDSVEARINKSDKSFYSTVFFNLYEKFKLKRILG